MNGINKLNGQAGELASCVERAVEGYFTALDGEPASNVHEMVMGCVEKALLTEILNRAGGNQTLAAEMLGMNRNTLRSKLKLYSIK